MFDVVPWPLFVLFFAAILLPLLYLLFQQRKADRLLTRAGLQNLRRMSGAEVIRYLEALFAGLGYQVERTAARTDYGADLILKNGAGRRTAVSARHFQEKVDVAALREVAEGAEYHRCQDTLLVSAVGFTNRAISMGEETGAYLWDTEDLADAMDKIRERGVSLQPMPQSAMPAAPFPPSGLPPAPVAAARSAAPAEPAAPPEPEGPTGPPCPVCGKPMEPRIAAGREIWLCSRFPRCNGAELK